MKTCNAHPAVQQITNAPKIRNSIQVPSVRFSRTFIVTCTFRFILIWLRVKTSFSVLSNAWSERQACYSSSSKRFGGNIFYFGRNEEENKAEGGNLLHTNTHTYTYTHTVYKDFAVTVRLICVFHCRSGHLGMRKISCLYKE